MSSPPLSLLPPQGELPGLSVDVPDVSRVACWVRAGALGLAGMGVGP